MQPQGLVTLLQKPTLAASSFQDAGITARLIQKKAGLANNWEVFGYMKWWWIVMSMITGMIRIGWSNGLPSCWFCSTQDCLSAFTTALEAELRDPKGHVKSRIFRDWSNSQRWPQWVFRQWWWISPYFLYHGKIAWFFFHKAGRCQGRSKETAAASPEGGLFWMVGKWMKIVRS